MDFRQRLQRAAERGQRARDEKARQEAAKALSEEEYRRLHSNYRLELSDHIESRLRQLADSFPGFQFETVVDENGWGAVVQRDDFSLVAGRRDSLFSRLLLVIAPFNDFHVFELVAKGTIRNKESFNRNHFQQLDEIDLESFSELVELWVLDYAEAFAAAN